MINKISAFVNVAFAAILTMSVFEPRLTDFRTGWGRTDFTATSALIIILWVLGLLNFFIGTILCQENCEKRITAAILLLGSFSSLAIITLSPTMYASGFRTASVSAIMLGISAS